MKIDIKIKAIVALFVLLFALPSCNDWLTIEPEDQLLKDNFWKTTEDVESGLAAMYDAMRDCSEECLIWGELRADMVDMGSSYGNYVNIAESNITSSNGAVNWSHYYNAINLANTLMSYDKEVYGNDVTFTKEMMDAIDAEAIFIRSLSLFYLTRLWRDIPLMTQASISDTNNVFIPKSSEKEVLDRIISDLTMAKDMAYTTEFEAETYHPGYKKGRANKYAIMALLADVYLWRASVTNADEDYKGAINYCNEIINSGLYDLEPQETWFNLYYPGNSEKESIFEIQFDDNIVSQENPIYNKLFPISGTPQMIPDMTQLKVLLTESDIRTCNQANPTLPNPAWKFYGTGLESPIPRSTSERDANFMFYRYADILLIYAEAQNELGNFSEANDYLSKVKERAGITHTYRNEKELMRTEILDERAREFLLEGKRWFDVLRFAKRNNYEDKELIVSMILSGADIKQQAVLRSKVYDVNSYYLPIPEDDIKANPKLVQNPYYDR